MNHFYVKYYLPFGFISFVSQKIKKNNNNVPIILHYSNFCNQSKSIVSAVLNVQLHNSTEPGSNPVGEEKKVVRPELY